VDNDGGSMYVKNTPLPLNGVMLLAGLVSLAPLGVDIYLAAIPTMAMSYGVELALVEASIPFFLIGMACGQLLGGPISDQFGRKHTVLGGSLIFCFASSAIVMFQSIEGLWAFRVLQALGAGLTSVSATSVIRDISSGKEGAINLIRVMQVMMVAPLIAPLIGMLIYQSIDWYAIFVFLILYSLMLLGFFLKLAPETSPRSARGNPLVAYGRLIQDSRVWPGLLTVIGAYGVMFSIVIASPTVYMGFFGIEATLFPFVFGANVLAMILASRINMRLLKRRQPGSVIQLGQGLQSLLCSLVLACLLIAPAADAWIIIPALMAIIGCNALIISNNISAITEHFPERAGTSTALLSATGFFSGAGIGSLTGVFADGTPLPMLVVIMAAASLGLLGRWLLKSKPAVAVSS
jgi:DHA1 family bicyclomycin/chloramphenicol resistance-like MFS transporter